MMTKSGSPAVRLAKGSPARPAIEPGRPLTDGFNTTKHFIAS